MFIDDTITEPAVVVDDVGLNSAIPKSRAPVIVNPLVNLPEPLTSKPAWGVEVPIPTFAPAGFNTSGNGILSLSLCTCM